MTEYNGLNVKLSNSLLNKLKFEIKNGTQVTFSSNVIGDSNDEANFPNKKLLANAQFSNICKDFANGLSANKTF